MFNYENLKKILFNFQPETAHNISEYALKVLPKVRFVNNYMVNKNFVINTKLKQEILGIPFINPVGLAAGFDKNATMVNSMMALGFAATEIGTMTPRPQDGNAKPRMFRHIESRSIQNAMGFNNAGSFKVAKNLKKVYPHAIVIGANIGKNKNTPEEFAINDYKVLIERFKDISDYIVINISSPNTPNLRDLQNETFIKELFVMAKKLSKKPIFLKIAPDMSVSNAISLSKCAIKAGAAGIIATNTTIEYALVNESKDFGGLSGACLSDKSYTLFKEIAKELFGKTILISVGGISTGAEAYRRIKAGASLVQAYSGMVFEGPSMVRKINEEILELLDKDGYNHISDAIGADLKNEK